MKRSPCFLESRDTPRPLECTTCHDPHEGFRDQGPAYFNETCLGCHAAEPLREQMPTAELRAQHAPDANCFSCHMPKVEADDAPHSSFTDHYIRVVRPEERLEREIRALGPSEILAPYYERDVASEEGAVYEGMAAVVFGTQSGDQEAMAHGAALLTNTLRPGTAEADTTHGEGHFLLGVAAHRLGTLRFAVPALEQAARLDPVPQRLEALALAYEAERRSPEVIERLYRRALALQPALAAVRTNYGRFLQAQGRRTGALAAYREARRERPSLDLAALLEGTVLTEVGREDEASAAFADAVRLDPANAELVANLLVVDANGAVRRYWSDEPVFGLSAQPAVAPTADGRGVRFLDLPSDATVRVYTAAGTPVRTLERRAGRPLPWDLRTDDGHRAEPGTYLVHVRTLTPTGQTLGTRLFRLAVARRAPDESAL
jgi:Flp pilus assembly protein TadD